MTIAGKIGGRPTKTAKGEKATATTTALVGLGAEVEIADAVGVVVGAGTGVTRVDETTDTAATAAAATTAGVTTVGATTARGAEVSTGRVKLGWGPRRNLGKMMTSQRQRHLRASLAT